MIKKRKNTANNSNPRSITLDNESPHKVHEKRNKSLISVGNALPQ